VTPVRPPAPRPCASCPYRRDVPSGVWAETEYAKLPEYDAETAYQPPGVFMCHQQDGRMCAGWTATHDMEDSLAFRLAAMTGDLPAEHVEAVLDYQTDVPLFGSGAEAAEHGLRDLREPGIPARQMVERLRRSQDRQRANVVFRNPPRRDNQGKRGTMAQVERAGKPRAMRKYGNGDFMGTREVAEFLGVEPPRIGRWLKREAEGKMKKLPTPVAILYMSPIWLTEQIEALKDGTPPEKIKSPYLDLVGTGEAAEILDMKKDRIGAWQREGVMPPVVARLRSGPLWWRTDVRRLRPERERRRRKATAMELE
jgi:hypothetical protein